MNFIKKIQAHKNFLVNITASIVIHAVLFFIISAVLYFTVEQGVQSSPYVELFTNSGADPVPVKEELKPEDKEEVTETVKEEEIVPEQKPEETTSGSISLSDENADTTALKNVYKEPTLNVTIKYPSGWTFIDQNVKNKLDGVTFWASRGVYDPPPYIHLEVKEKYLFNPSRYKYKEELKDYTAYYNDPKELSGQVSQEIYLVTETDEDYSIKLIMKGQEAFNSFQPVFFGMLKTFKFGRSLF